MYRPSIFQFQHTRQIRWAVYRKARLSSLRTVLEVGAGECLCAQEMAQRTGRKVFALDLEPPSIRPSGVEAALGDAHALPFTDGVFDAVAFNFVLLWLKDPLGALSEAHRVLKAGGVLLVLAEPDLTRRLDDPDTGLGVMIAEAVRRSGGHPDAGERLPHWLARAGFRPELEQTPPEWTEVADRAEILHELDSLRERGMLDGAQAEELRAREEAVTKRRVMIVVTYGIGKRLG
jgi:SAM-dependent methyltransferase